MCTQQKTVLPICIWYLDICSICAYMGNELLWMMIDGEKVLLYIALTPSQGSQQSSQVNTFKVCTHLALRAALLPIRSESLFLHIEGRMWNWFSQQTYRESLAGHVPHLNSLKALPHPVGGSCWKEECDSASTSETNTGWREEDHSAPNIISPVFPVPFPFQFFISGCWYVSSPFLH